MSRNGFVLLAAAAAGLFVAACKGSSSPATPTPAPAVAATPAGPVVKKGTAPPNEYPKELVEKGRVLVLGGSCNDCHTPWVFNPALGAPAPDFTRMLSGHPSDGPEPEGELGPGDIALIGPTFTSFKLPFGTNYSMNLTPDIATGSGTWTEKMFIDIFRKGRHLGGDGRPVYPPMPWPYLRQLGDDDLKAIFAYLRSIPPIENSPKVGEFPPPVFEGIRAMNDGIIAMQDKPGIKLPPAKNAPPPPPPIKLAAIVKGKGGKKQPAEKFDAGKRLVTAGLCNDCHTPWVYDPALAAPAPDPSRMLMGHPEGAPDPQGKLGEHDIALIGPTFTAFKLPFGTVYAMNLTPDDETGIGKYTEQQFLDVFRKGEHPNGTPVLPPMPWAMIRNFSDDDLKNIYAYLQSIPPLKNKVPAAKVDAPVVAGMKDFNGKLMAGGAP